jgi:selenocysteine lyase/cysteine desulfurase
MMVAFDVERARRETRGCEERIHFNNAGASLPPIPVADALYDYLRDEEEQGGYEVMARRAAELDQFYTATAKLLNCSSDEIAFADSATRAWNAVFYAFDFQPGDRILASSAEYGSSLVALLHQTKRLGVEISWMPDDPSGQIDINSLESQIDNRVKLICLTQVPSGGGLVNPAAEVGKAAKAAGIPYLLDACQALGQMSVDVDQIGCDLLCGTGRKFLRGPRGSGLLYVRKTLLEQLEPNQLNHHAAPLLSPKSYQLRSDAKRFEFWERSYAVQLSLGVAIDYALAWGLGAISERVRLLATTLRQKLAGIDGVTLADQGVEQCAIVTFFAAQLPADQMQQQLALRQINTSTVPFTANPVSSEKLHRPALLRASLHYYNTVEEIECFVTELKQIL